LLVPGDVLVLNNTQVVAGRLLGRKASGGKVEALILDYAEGMQHNRFNCLLKASKRPKPGSRLHFENGLDARVIEVAENRALLTFEGPGEIETLLEAAGHVPLPPYIRRGDTPDDRQTYQTVYAAAKGAIAAPTAGLHFTPSLLAHLARQGVEIVFLTLHVGYGTFVPVRVDDIRDHRMHAEAFTVPAQTARTVNQAKAQGRRVIAVGTTSVRTLEFCADDQGRLSERSGWCDLFIYPGYHFKLIDGMITNFHLPQSTLLMLVAAFARRDVILDAYAEAVRQRYRFFSYGDAMAIL
jgi:S-adenosylmethionine:tRNA ribosyltransferase-isomerase